MALSFLVLVATLLPIALCDPMWSGQEPSSHHDGRSLRLFGHDHVVGDLQVTSSHHDQQGHAAASGSSSSYRLFGVDIDPFANLSMQSHSGSGGGGGGGQESYQHDHYPDHSMAHETDTYTGTGTGTDTNTGMMYDQDEDMGYYDYAAGEYYPDHGYQEGEGEEPIEDEDHFEDQAFEELEEGEIPPETGKKVDIDHLIQTAPLEQILDMKLSLKESQLRLLMERFLPTLSFYVIDPSTSQTEHVSVAQGHGILHIIGHPDNYKLYQSDVTRRWPDSVQLNEEEAYDKTQAEQALRRSQSVMRNLCKDARAGVYHEPSGKIFMSPLASHEDTELIGDLVDRYWKGLLPKLRYSDMLHYKTSYDTKLRHRAPQLGARDKGKKVAVGKTLDEETSSQGSNTEMEEDQSQSMPDQQDTFAAIPRKARSRKMKSVDQI